MSGRINYAFFFLLSSFSCSTWYASFPSALDHATPTCFRVTHTLARKKRKKSNTSAVPVGQGEREKGNRATRPFPFFFGPRDARREPLLNEIHTCWRAGNGVSTLSPRWQPLNYNWTRRWPLFFEFIQIREIKRRTRAFLRGWKGPAVRAAGTFNGTTC